MQKNQLLDTVKISWNLLYDIPKKGLINSKNQLLHAVKAS